MQKRLDEIASHRCIVRLAEYSDDGELQLSSLRGAHVLIPAMARVSARTPMSCRSIRSG